MQIQEENMIEKSSEEYKGWKIEVGKEDNMCSNYSFDIIDSSGNGQHVKMGGETRERALERAKEMIDLEKKIETES